MAETTVSGSVEPNEASADTPRPSVTSRRRDIQGLRAVAVLMVVAFHAGLPVPGGFVGVDVFFVISGFVITAMLQREVHDAGRIDFGRFYRRRFQRLTPALALMVAITLVVSLALLSPLGPLQNAAKTGVGALLLVANFVIARTTGGYFDAPAETNPLLHTWSLSVEEQFYLVFPLALTASWMVARKRHGLRHAAPVVVCGIAVVSFGVAVLYSAGRLPSGIPLLSGFYTPVSRAWEFGVGALLAMVATRLPRLTLRQAAMAGLFGAVLLASSLWLISDTTPMPGPWTLLPVLGTLLVIAAGTAHDQPVGRVLATTPMVRIGDLSYSIYLWHWPFIVFAAILWPGSSRALFLAALVSFAPAALSYHLVEQPIRTLRLPGRGRILRLVAVVMIPALAVAAGALVVADRVLEPRYDSGEIAAEHHGAIGWTNFVRVETGFFACTAPELTARTEAIDGFAANCRQSKATDDVDLAIIGDSHAAMLFLGLAEALPDKNVLYFSGNGFPTADDPSFTAAYKFLRTSPSIDAVLITAFFGREFAGDEVVDTLRGLAKHGRAVFVTDDIPNFSFEPFQCKYKVLVRTVCSEDRDDSLGRRADFVRNLRAAAAAVPGTEIIGTAKYFCDASDCSMLKGDELLYRDNNHLNFRGSRYLAPKILENARLRDSLTLGSASVPAP